MRKMRNTLNVCLDQKPLLSVTLTHIDVHFKWHLVWWAGHWITMHFFKHWRNPGLIIKILILLKISGPCQHIPRPTMSLLTFLNSQVVLEEQFISSALPLRTGSPQDLKYWTTWFLFPPPQQKHHWDYNWKGWGLGTHCINISCVMLMVIICVDVLQGS